MGHHRGLVCRRCPTLPHPTGCSTIGAGELSFRVRYGTGRTLPAVATDNAVSTHPHKGVGKSACCVVICLQYSRPGLLFQSRIVGAKQGVVKSSAYQYRSAPHVTVLPHPACQPSHLLGALLGSHRWETSSRNRLPA